MPLTPIRLTEIPFEKRMTAARIAAKACHSETEVTEVMAAALFPSERVYFVRSEAVSEVLRAA